VPAARRFADSYRCTLARKSSSASAGSMQGSQRTAMGRNWAYLSKNRTRGSDLIA
jgi:hypothetical protein